MNRILSFLVVGALFAFGCSNSSRTDDLFITSSEEIINSEIELDDSYEHYFSNGLLKSKSVFENGMNTGWIDRYDSISGKLYERVHPTPWSDLNMWMIYDSTGKLDSTLGHYVCYETIGDFDTLNIFTINWYFGDKFTVTIADFDASFQLIPNTLDSIYDVFECNGLIPLHGKRKVILNDIKILDDSTDEMKAVLLDLERYPCFHSRCQSL
jgi:hypothetical protein